MSVIDERIVSVKFDNNAFGRKIAETQKGLQSLNQSLQMKGATTGLDQAAKTVGRFSAANMISQLDSISSKFTTMGVVAATTISNITNRFINAGIEMAKSFTLGPITDGFSEYETKLGSIQTILANTASAGTNLKQVTETLNELNHYSDQTIYNFGEMAKNIGTFTAAGVGLETATASIKGIANLAALSGSNSQQAASAMYQLSQAISAGRVSLMDWNSVVNAGMGGSVFQRALAQNAEKMGTLKKGAVELKGEMKNVTIEGKSFRDSISGDNGPSWLTSDVLTETLKQFTGDMTDAELAAKGFNKEQISAIQKQAQMAKSAATEVKSFTQLMGTIKESIGSGWAQTFEIIFGDFNEAKSLFTGVNNVVGGFVQRTSDARNKMLADWDKLGGRKAVLEGLSNAFKSLYAIVKPVTQAFREIFPAITGKQLADISKSFRDFTSQLTPSSQTLERIGRIAKGVFAALDIGRMFVVGLVKGFLQLFGAVGSGSGNFLEFAASIGDFIVGVRDAIKQGEFFTKFFEGIGKILAVPIRLLGQFVGFVAGLFSGISFGNLAQGLGEAARQTTLFSTAGRVLSGIWRGVVSAFEGSGKAIKNAISAIGNGLSDAFSNLNFEDILGTIQTGLLGILVFSIKSFITRVKGLFGQRVDTGGGLVDSIKESLGGITDTLSAMQNALRATTLLQIAIALGVLTASVVALSKIDAEGLGKALTALTAMFTQLGIFLYAMQVIGLTGGLGTLAGTAALLTGLATAVRILADAMQDLESISWQGIAKGLIAVGALLTGLALFTKFAAVDKGGLRSGAGLVLLAAAIKILASAVEDLGALDATTLAKGVTSIGLVLAAFAGFSRIVSNPAALLAAGPALVLVAAAMKILASAVKDLGSLDVGTLAKGLYSMVVALASIGAALYLIPPTAPLQAAGIAIVAGALKVLASAVDQIGSNNLGTLAKGIGAIAIALAAISTALSLLPPTAVFSAAAIGAIALAMVPLAGALKILGGMSVAEIAKSLVTLAGALTVLSVGMLAMLPALPGAAALVVVSAALALFVPVLLTLGAMPFAVIATGLGALAATFAILGVSGLLLAPVTPILLGLSVAIAIFGAGIALAGAGVLAFSAGLALLASVGAAVGSVMVNMVRSIVAVLPDVAIGLANALVSFIQEIAKAAPKIAKAFGTIIKNMLKIIKDNVPLIVGAVLGMLNAILDKIVSNAPKFINSAIRLLMAFMRGIRDSIPGLVRLASEIIQRFMDQLGKEAPALAQKGVELIINLVNAVANAIRNNQAAIQGAAKNLGSAIIQGMIAGITGGVSGIISAAKSAASSALQAAKERLGIASPSKEFKKVGAFAIQGFIIGLRGDREGVKKALADMKTMLQDLYNKSGEDITKYTEKLKRLRQTQVDIRKQIQKAKRDLKDDDASNIAAITKARKNLDKAKKGEKVKGKIVVDKDDVKNAEETLRKARARAGATARDAEERLRKLQIRQKNNADDIKKTTLALKQSTSEHNAAKKAYDAYMANIAKYKNKLLTLATAHDKVVDKLEEEKKKLEDLKKQRDDYANSTTDSYNKQIDFVGDDTNGPAQLDLVKKAFLGYTQQNTEFLAALTRARTLGLSDDSYREFIKQGTGSKALLDQLIAGGDAEIKQFNALTAALKASARAIGETGATELYQAGIDAAQGLVDGLKAQEAAIAAQMAKIAALMQKSIKNGLKIKSPSRVMAEIGMFTAQGLAQGLDRNADLIQASSENLGKAAIFGMQKSIADISDLVSAEIDVNPTIRPVLDLTDIQKNASAIDGILGTTTMPIDGTFAAAKLAAIQFAENAAASSEATAGDTIHLEYTQNNNSPKALSAIEIYRQTRTQLSSAKEVLKK